MTIQFLVSGTSFSTPATWNNSNNSIECIGGGAGAGTDGSAIQGGGGAGAYAKISNLTISGSITYQVGAAGVGGIVGVQGPTNGTPTYFNGGSLAASSVGAQKGNANSGATPGLGGEQPGNTGSVGTIKNAGGSGAAAAGGVSGGGGGAGGLNGAGNTGSTTTGGSGDAGLGGAGGPLHNNGSPGTEYDASHGSGGGGGAGDGAGAAGTGGAYGAAGGGSTVNPGGAGAQGLIVVTWQPYVFFGFGIQDSPQIIRKIIGY